LFAAFSALTTNPNDTRSRQLVLNQAQELGRSYNSAATSLENITGQARQQITSSVESINRLAVLVRDVNVRQGLNSTTSADPTIDARLNQTLENLSEFAGVQVLRQNDGSLTLLLGGQTALVVGQNVYPFMQI